MRARPLFAAFAVSLTAHAWLLAGTWIPVAVKPAPPPVLEARVIERAPPAPAALAQPERRVAQRAAAPRPAQSDAVFVAPRLEDRAALAFPLDPEPTASTEPVDEASSTASPLLSSPDAPPIAAHAEPKPFPKLPRNGQLTYTLYLGSDKFSVGRTVQTWQAGDDTYKLASTSETTGVADMFRPQRLIYTSEGTLSERGLRPVRFSMTRTRRGQTDAAEAKLDWGTGRITYGRPAQARTVELPATSQDIVSFIFQLALNPPDPGRVRLPITNGVRFETYELEVFAEERLETPLGVLTTLPLKQVRRNGSEGIEVWLAVEYRYLPVKVRFLDRDGNQSGEQIVNEIRISQE